MTDDGGACTDGRRSDSRRILTRTGRDHQRDALDAMADGRPPNGRRARLRAAPAMVACALACLSGCAHHTRPPEALQPAGPSPAELLAGRTFHAPPPLTGTGASARESVRLFVDWAGFSIRDEREDARAVIQGARGNADIAAALCDEIGTAAASDHSRALLAIAILGEMRAPAGETCLRDLVRRPLPSQGTEANGEIAEATALAMLQAKAIDGLAYLGTPSGDAEVLQAIAQHPSVVVRAEAIDAYLWNHRDAPSDARAAVSRHVRPGEAIFLDRIRREEGERAESFNAKLDAYVKAHPEVAPVLLVPEGRPPVWSTR